MAIKTSGSLQIGEIYNEFGGPIPGGLLNYLAGGALVRAGTTGISGAIPSSPPISIRQFLGASYEASALALTSNFWDYRGELIRYTSDPAFSYYPPTAGTSPNGGGVLYSDTPYYNIAPGDELTYVNNYHSRYTSQYTDSWTHNMSSSPRLSKYFTVITVATGRISDGERGGIIDAGITCPGSYLENSGRFTAIGDGTIPGYPGNQVGGNGYGVSFNVAVHNGDIRNLTNSYSTYVRAYSREGAWQQQYILQGRWWWEGFSNHATETTTWSVPSGEFVVYMYERGGDGLIPIGSPNRTIGTFTSSTIDYWWYNGGGGQISLNLTGSTQTHSYMYPDQYGVIRSIAPAFTPRIYNRFYRY
jgi:hypothetical protein